MKRSTLPESREEAETPMVGNCHGALSRKWQEPCRSAPVRTLLWLTTPPSSQTMRGMLRMWRLNRRRRRQLPLKILVWSPQSRASEPTERCGRCTGLSHLLHGIRRQSPPATSSALLPGHHLPQGRGDVVVNADRTCLRELRRGPQSRWCYSA
jgi:hypothetical protein